MKRQYFFVLLILMLFWVASTEATVSMEWVPVDNPGNAGELSGETAAGDPGGGPDRICGAVDYTYKIGKYEVTAGQYTEFLNAVAKTDTYGLYNQYMVLPHPNYGDGGCKIERSGAPGSYTYSVASDWANRPVNYVSWGDVTRFTNWLTNGQPTGPQGLATTEDGSYYLNGAMTNVELMMVTRESDARYVIPTEDEWYKSAYHKNDGVTGNYWNYPTATDDRPNNGNPEGDTGNSANYNDGDYTIGSPYWRTEVGHFANSPSAYGTFDQGGNVWEWDEAMLYGDGYRGIRGGNYDGFSNHMHAVLRQNHYPANEDRYVGFRVAEVPEPATLLLLGVGGVLLRRKHKA